MQETADYRRRIDVHRKQVERQERQGTSNARYRGVDQGAVDAKQVGMKAAGLVRIPLHT